MSGSQIGGAVGFLVGSFFGAPQLGFFLGSTLGGIVDPTKIKGPRLSDAQAQTSQEGIPIPFGYGTFPCAGNVIWAGPLVEHEEEEGGKGGPVTVTYSYTRSYAIGVCEGPISGIVRIKRNGKLVYDISPTSTIRGKSAKFLRRCTIYLGDETQLVDPVIEAEVGANMTSPYRGLAYIVMEDDDLTDSQGAIAQYEFVVQKCGTVTDLADAREYFVASMVGVNSVETGTRAGAWTAHGDEIPGNFSLDRMAAERNVCVSYTTGPVPDKFYWSDDYGVNWTEASVPPSTTNIEWTDLAIGNGRVIAVGQSTAVNTTSHQAISYDGGDTWTTSEISGVQGAQRIVYGAGIFVLLCGANGLFVNGIWTSATGQTWTQRSTVSNLADVAFNGTNWLAVGNSGASYYAGPLATVWTYGGSSPGGGTWSFNVVTGGPGFFVASANGGYGTWRTTNLGSSWTHVNALANGATGSTYGLGTALVTDGEQSYFSYDAGLTWTAHPYASALHYASDVAFMGPNSQWYVVPDGDGLYADENGNLITDYAESEELSECHAILSDIVADLCERAGIESTEYDVSELTDTVTGYKCATEASAQAFIEPLCAAFFFDRGEWDKKIRFIKRGGSSVASLGVSDLLAREGPVIDQTRIQEPELLWRVNVMTIDPEAGYNDGKQTAQRRISTINAKGEATVEIPIVTDADTAARIAEKRLKVAWAETDKFSFGYSLAYSKLTPTDVITLTDPAGKAHRVRLTSVNEEGGAFAVDEASKDRAATYASTATGVRNPNEPPPEDSLSGPTLFAAMNLPQLRTQDNTPGVYVAAAGILSGWPGCQIYLSLDGGVSYQVVKTITVASTLGFLTADVGAADSPDVLYVHVFGGTLESKTTAQVAAGGNYAAVVSSDVAEVVSFEDATETTANYYTLATLERALLDTVAAAHESGDVFADLATVYFVPIDSSFEGTTLYFKAVTLGQSPDEVDATTLVFAATEYILDGGGA